ncbi:hypothetical protein E4U10_000380, partial [Claviceps purpurea]
TRMEDSVLSQVPLTPSVYRTFSKARKAGYSLALNGITATREMRVVKDKALARTNRRTQNGIISKFGPISVGDARLRVAKDNYGRLAAQKEEKERIFKRSTLQEKVFLCRWTMKVRARQDRRACLDNTLYISQHYALLREMCAAENAAAEDSTVINSTLLHDPAVTAAQPEPLSYRASHYKRIMMWPEEYDEAIVTAAIELAVSPIERKAASRPVLQLETDGIRLTSETEASGDPDNLSRLGQDDDLDDSSGTDQMDMSF